jgi:DNA-binding HxlR family transcriptional regulator
MSPGHIERPPRSCIFTRELLNRVGDKWSLFIIGNLAAGPMRFNELKREIGDISQRMLTLTLKGLEKDGLVTRTVFPTIPPRVDYELTSLGRTLLEPVIALVNWADDHRDDVEMARIRYEKRMDVAS